MYELITLGKFQSVSLTLTLISFLSPAKVEALRSLRCFTSKRLWRLSLSIRVTFPYVFTSGSPPYPELDPQSVLPKLQRSYRMKRPYTCGGPL